MLSTQLIKGQHLLQTKTAKPQAPAETPTENAQHKHTQNTTPLPNATTRRTAEVHAPAAIETHRQDRLRQAPVERAASPWCRQRPDRGARLLVVTALTPSDLSPRLAHATAALAVTRASHW